jgi:hypothetical protein
MVDVRPWWPVVKVRFAIVSDIYHICHWMLYFVHEICCISYIFILYIYCSYNIVQTYVFLVERCYILNLNVIPHVFSISVLLKSTKNSEPRNFSNFQHFWYNDTCKRKFWIQNAWKYKYRFHRQKSN